jgi:hypothetical protein
MLEISLNNASGLYTCGMRTLTLHAAAPVTVICNDINSTGLDTATAGPVGSKGNNSTALSRFPACGSCGQSSIMIRGCVLPQRNSLVNAEAVGYAESDAPIRMQVWLDPNIRFSVRD